jgi:tetratricopeptide (TPR) repeat protein
MSLYPDHVIAEVNQTLDIQQLLEYIDYKTNKLQDSGDTIRGFCPIHRESVFRTLVINKSQRTFRCMYGLCEGSRGGSLVQLLALSRKITTDEAAKEIIDSQGLTISTPVDPALLIRNVEVAENYLSLGQLDEAEQLFQQILSMRADLIRAHEGLLELARKRGNQAEEIQRLGQLARAHLEAGRPEQAMVYAGQWEAMRPEDIRVKYLRAECALAGGMVTDALFAFLEVADQSEANNQLEAALEAYARAEKLQLDYNLDEVDVLPHILRVLQALGRTDEAVEYLTTRAERLATQSQMVQASSLYAEAIAYRPDDLTLHERFVEIMVQAPLLEELVPQLFASVELFKTLERFDLAIHALQRFNENNPGHGPGLQKLADLLYADGRPAEGANVEAELALMALANDRAVEARDRIMGVLEWQPDHPECLRTLAQIEDALKDRLAAINARRRLAKALLQRRDFHGALEAIDTALASDPHNSELLEQRAATLETMGNVLQDADALREAASIYAALAMGTTGLGEGTDRVREMRLLERAVGADPNPSNDILFRLARAYLANAKTTQARDTAIRACESLAASGDIDQAILAAEQFSALMQTDNDLVYYQAELLLRMGDGAAAARRLRKLARQRAMEGQGEEAEEIFQQALRIVPDEAGAIDELAEIFRDAGDEDRYLKALLRAAGVHESRADFNSAIRALSAVVETLPEDTPTIQRIIDHCERLKRTDLANEWRVRLAKAYRAVGDLEREARVLREVLHKDPEQEGALRQLILTDLDRGDQAAAIRNARRLASKQASSNRPAEALATLRTVVDRIPDQPELLMEAFKAARDAADLNAVRDLGLRLVRALQDVGRMTDAVQTMEQLAVALPTDVDIQRQRVALLLSNGQTDAATEARIGLARALQRSESFTEAEQELKAILAEQPQNIVAREELIDLYGRLGQAEAVEEQLSLLAEQLKQEGVDDGGLGALRRILAINPENVGARRQLIEYLLQMDTPESCAEAVVELHRLADFFRKSGNETEALLSERLAADALPLEIPPRRRLAESYIALERLEPAAEELCVIASIHRDSGRIRDALMVLEEAVALHPKCATARRMRADLYTLPGPHNDPAAALAEYKFLTTILESGPTVGTSSEVDQLHPGLKLMPEYVFDNFIIGPSNRFAHATALAVARNPARAYNPVFIYSDVGLGKTHLINAIANYVSQADPAMRIVYTSAEDFTEALVQAISSNSTAAFLARYKSVDMLLVDDIQFLSGSQRAQEEFFNLFNALFQAKRQIVVTSDRPPSNLTTLEARLRGRFGSGVIVDIQPPDLETRLAILQSMAAAEGLSLPPDSMDRVVQLITSNIRDLRAVVNQLKARRDLGGIEITPDVVDEIDFATGVTFV